MDKNFVCDTPDDGHSNPGDLLSSGRSFYFVPLADYNRMMNTSETLKKDEALLFAARNSSYDYDTISFEHGMTYTIKKEISDFSQDSNALTDVLTTMVLIVPDVHEAIAGVQGLADGTASVFFHWIYHFNTGLEKDDQITLSRDLQANLSDDETGYRCFVESQAENYEIFFADFGSLFYLAIVLSIVFVLAAVLIIYYKQISEGYEDRARFEIMQKVGMTKKEIRKSINSQLLTVFFLPLIGAGIHLIFAFPMIRQILLLFNLSNLTLFTQATLVSFCLFALFYAIVYRITSNAYYTIVSDVKKE